jgi:hypothetical protein
VCVLLSVSDSKSLVLSFSPAAEVTNGMTDFVKRVYIACCDYLKPIPHLGALSLDGDAYSRKDYLDLLLHIASSRKTTYDKNNTQAKEVFGDLTVLNMVQLACCFWTYGQPYYSYTTLEIPSAGILAKALYDNSSFTRQPESTRLRLVVGRMKSLLTLLKEEKRFERLSWCFLGGFNKESLSDVMNDTRKCVRPLSYTAMDALCLNQLDYYKIVTSRFSLEESKVTTFITVTNKSWAEDFFLHLYNDPLRISRAAVFSSALSDKVKTASSDADLLSFFFDAVIPFNEPAFRLLSFNWPTTSSSPTLRSRSLIVKPSWSPEVNVQVLHLFLGQAYFPRDFNTILSSISGSCFYLFLFVVMLFSSATMPRSEKKFAHEMLSLLDIDILPESADSITGLVCKDASLAISPLMIEAKSKPASKENEYKGLVTLLKIPNLVDQQSPVLVFGGGFKVRIKQTDDDKPDKTTFGREIDGAIVVFTEKVTRYIFAEFKTSSGGARRQLLSCFSTVWNAKPSSITQLFKSQGFYLVPTQEKEDKKQDKKPEKDQAQAPPVPKEPKGFYFYVDVRYFSFALTLHHAHFF